ncbi:flagellar assembly protein FliW [Thalassospira lucentensis]|uniref:flagellar assembly protein FliW n=1 Tax=Thalassospira lucentensis TaxID=168935 RepID=UPI0011BE42D7|nr:flagellar assembly protein FliW [Thalassospira lucentensis]
MKSGNTAPKCVLSHAHVLTTDQQEEVMATPTETTPPAPQAVPSSVRLTTLFGEREFEWDKAIYFPAGLKGFPDHNVFALANFPGDGASSFLLMQCLTEPELAFIVAPYNMDSDTINPEHLEQAFTIHGIKKNDGAVLLIVTLHKPEDNGDVSMSVNLRAPIIIDTERQSAYQHHLPEAGHYDFHHVVK